MLVLQDARYNPVRAVLAVVPPSGAQKYDMVGNLLRGTLEGEPAEPGSAAGVRSKYDIVWQLLEAGRRSGATVAPKFDPVAPRALHAACAPEWCHRQPLGLRGVFDFSNASALWHCEFV